MLAIAVGNKEGMLSACNIDARIRHSAMIIPQIAKLLKKAGLSKEDIDMVAVGLGPGSLTGIRIGVATAQGLCVGLAKPILGICSLDIIARNANCDNIDICTLVDARRSLVYSAVYRKANAGFRRIRPPALSPLEEVLPYIKPGAVFTGDAAHIYEDLIKRRIKNARLLDKNKSYPRAENIWELALLYRDKRMRSIERLRPIYLYPKECQIRK